MYMAIGLNLKKCQFEALENIKWIESFQKNIDKV